MSPEPPLLGGADVIRAGGLVLVAVADGDADRERRRLRLP